MFITIIRIMFWVLVFSQIVLLIFGSGIKKRISVAYTDCSFIFKIFFLAVYAYFTRPEISLHIDFFLKLIGFAFVIWLVFQVRRICLAKAIRLGSIYQMTNLSYYSDSQQDGDSYLVYGDIDESGYIFRICIALKTETFMSLHAQGYFDSHAQGKFLLVKVLKTKTSFPIRRCIKAAVQIV